jgi:hypothetical protein
MKALNKNGARSSGARVSYTFGFLAFAVAVASACGGGEGEDDSGGGLGGAGGTSSGGTSSGGSSIITFGGEGPGGTTGSSMGGGCGESPFDAAPTPVNILLVIDKSGSMDTDIASGVTRWDAMVEAVNAAVDGSKASISYGLALYPTDADSCGSPTDLNVPVQAGTDAVDPIATELSGTSPSGGTPTAGALQVALDYFANGDGSTLEGDKYVLLATDGGPNCNPDLNCNADGCTLNIEHAQDPSLYPACTAAVNCCDSDAPSCLDDVATTSAVQDLADAGIKTIVVGIPGTEAYDTLLDTLGTTGNAPNPDGPPAYYKVEAGSASGLADVLTSITQGLIKICDFKLASVPQDSSLLNVEIDGEKIAPDPDNGWSYDMDTNTVTLLGDTCDKIKTEGAQSVRVLYGCQTVPK